MAATFDPYYTWLGIPPENQPPDYYCLLGARRFEPNSQVIANLADQRMAHVLTFQSGPHGGESQRLLDDIAAARLCLLHPEKRQQYDAQLRSQPNGAETLTPAQPPPGFPAGPPAAQPLADMPPTDSSWPVAGQFAGAAAESGSWPGNTSFDVAPEEPVGGGRKKLRRKRVVSPGVTIFMQLLGIPTAIGLYFLIQKFVPGLKDGFKLDLPAAVSPAETPGQSGSDKPTHSAPSPTDSTKSSE